LEDNAFTALARGESAFKVEAGDRVFSPAGVRQSPSGKLHPCLGCFGCWIKTPLLCVIHDGYERLGEYCVNSEELIIISKCFYGGYSPFVKNILDRSIGVMLPFFEIIRGKMHHSARTKNHPKLSVYLYGPMTEAEYKTAAKLVEANAINFHASYSLVNLGENPGGIQ
jgi:multimeric flavodoxin WrbA